MSNSNNQREAMFEFWRILARYRWRLVIPAFLIAVLVLTCSVVLPRKYKAEAIFERRTDMVLSEIMNRGAPRTFQEVRQALTNEIIGEPAIDALLKSLKQDTWLAAQTTFDPQALRSEILHKANVAYDISSNELDRVRVTFIGEDPIVSRAVVNQLVRNYIDRTRGHIDERLKQSSQFFTEEADRARRLIEELENAQLTFEIEHAELLPENPNSVQAMRPDVDQQLVEATRQRDAASTRVDALKKALARTPATVPSVVRARHPELTRLEEAMRVHEAKLAEAIGVFKMKEKHPDVIAIRQQMAAIRAEIAKTDKEVVTETHQSTNPRHGELELLLAQAESDWQATDRRVESLTKQVEAIEAVSGNMFTVRSDYRKLTRKIDEAQRQLAFWEDNQRHVQMALTAESGDRGILLALIKECAELTRPVSPDLVQVLLAATLLGLIGGAVSVFYAYRTDETFHDARKLSDAFNLPTFGAVSEIISNRQRRLRKLRQYVLYPVNGALMALVLIGLMGVLYVSLEKPHLAEEFQKDPARFIEDQIETRLKTRN